MDRDGQSRVLYTASVTVPIGIPFPFKGTLALAGSGEYLPAMNSVDQALLSRLPGPARVVCLPTAAGTEGVDRLRYWMELGENHFRSLGVTEVQSLRVVTRSDAQDPGLVRQVQEANFIYLSGGKPYYLLECLSGTPVLDAIMENLREGGIVAGCSAGAMIFGERVPNKSFIGGTVPAFGLLPGHFIIPHFDEVPFVLRFAVPHLAGNLTLIGIEANTVLACSNDSFDVLGTGAVALGHGNELTRYSAA
jgi:cyanophycinase